MDYTVVIGLEVHVQLLTQSKLFCACANRFNPDQPNVQTCPVCLGLPGSLPVLNKRAVELAVKTGLALNCNIPPFTKWDRKQYYYPDLPKAYQISQYDLPLCEDGWLKLEIDPDTEQTKRVGIIRAHLEEDAGKNIHDETGRGGESRVDLNRCGTPLVEIVTQPDLRSPAEARTFLEELRLLLVYLNVSDCNMQEGSLRCDANINLHVHKPDGHRLATPIVEIKNLNSFRNVEIALEYEVQRQWDEWQETENTIDDVPKQTRGFDAGRGITYALRGKEEASDYRYFPDPDLVPVTLSEADVERVRQTLCEFPADRRRRFRVAYLLSNYDADVIVSQGIAFADYFEQVAQTCGDGKQTANWVTQDVLREMNERGLSIDEFPIRAELLGALLARIVQGKITVKSGREIFGALFESGDAAASFTAADVDRIIAEKGLEIVSDTGALEPIIDAVLAKNQKAVDAFLAGKEAAVGPLIGQIMKELKGADPKTVRQLLIDRIKSRGNER